jgi:hypothetical protein
MLFLHFTSELAKRRKTHKLYLFF